jgi:hypothetical protein
MSNNHDVVEDAPVAGDGELYGVLAQYDTPGELIEACRRVRDAGYTEFDAYSPFPVHGIDEAMGIKRTILPLIVFGAGLTGLIGAAFLQWWMNAYNWPWNIAGKPTWSIPANIAIMFEGTILFSVLASFFGMWILNKLPQVWHPFFRSDKFLATTDDGFFLGIEARDKRFDQTSTTKLLQDAGSIGCENVYLEVDPRRKNMPRFITAFIVASTAFALIPFAIAAKARNSHSNQPHMHIFPDMDFQPKYKADTADDLFEDGRANRGVIAGTVARGELNADEVFYNGLEKGADGQKQWITGFPKQLDLSEGFMKRGQQRFNIYCTPCHNYDGHGNGIVSQRIGQWAARNLVEDNGVVMNMPNGQLFNTISNGTSQGLTPMMGYAAQIPVADRWAIVFYVRALERSQRALETDVPSSDKATIR